MPPNDAFTHDLVIIGTGSGNSVITDQMADWRIAVVEEWDLGGTCLNRGCIPSKMFVVTADHAHAAATPDRFDLVTRFVDADWPAIRDRIFGRIDPIVASGRDYRQSQDHVDLYERRGHFVGPRHLRVGDETISAPRIVLATGARADLPSWPGLADDDLRDRVHTSDTVMRIDELPDRMVIVGGGFIATEMAHVFGSLGVEVTIVVRGPKLLRHEDPDVADRVTEIYAQRFDVRLDTDVTAVTAADGSATLHLVDGDDVTADLVLLATGRIPNSDNLGLEHTGVEVDDAGYVVVDEFQRTTVEGIWALGDVSSPEQLKHKANADARLVAHNLANPDDLRTSALGPVPYAVFGSPQVASVGATEPELRAAGVDPLVATHDYGGAAYGWALEDTTSFAKVLADRDTRLLLGAHVVGPQASTLIQMLVQGMQFGQTVDELARGQWWIHPALPEVVEQALLKL